MKTNKIYHKRNVVVGVLTNLCLAAVIILTFFSMGINYVDARATLKTYNGVIYAGNEVSGKVALMINVYWGTEYLEEMLNIFNKNNVKCTFFVGGTWVEENPELLNKIYKSGHEIGNHGTNHKEHGKINYSLNKSEIQSCHNSVYRLLNLKMNLFAPPGGSYNKDTVSCAENLGYKTILWTKDTIDWRDQNEELIYNRATANLGSGDLILMHPTKATKNVLERIIEYVNGKNLALDTVSNTIKE